MIDDLLLATPRLDIQLTLLLLHAVFWAAITRLAKLPIKAFVVRQSAAWQARWLQFNRKWVHGMLGRDDIMTDDKATLDFAAGYLGVMLQHIVGGCLCVPSLLGLQSLPTVPLAAHGALCEAGWELQDMVRILRDLTLGGEEGRANNPTVAVVFMTLHHSVGLALVVPMNASRYHSSALYHEGVFMLQLAAAIAGLMQQYGFSLDVSTRGGLLRMKVSVCLVFTVVAWTRVVRYAWVLSGLLAEFEATGAFALWRVCLTVAILMGLFNVIILLDCAAKLAKFLPMSVSDERIVELQRQLSTSFRLDSIIELTRTQSRWAKLRGAVLFGAVKAGPEKRD